MVVGVPRAHFQSQLQHLRNAVFPLYNVVELVQLDHGPVHLKCTSVTCRFLGPSYVCFYFPVFFFLFFPPLFILVVLAVRSVLIGLVETTLNKNKQDKRSSGEFIQFISLFF